jgi:DNA-binding CsgD family transcriptional regulator
VGSVQDITEARHASREIAAHVAAAEAMAAWDSLEQGAVALIGKLGEAMGFEVGSLWLVDHDALAAHAFWHSPSVRVAEFERVTRALRFPKGAGLPGQVWEVRHPIGLVKLREDSGPLPHDHARSEAAAAAGLRSALALPVTHADEVVAVLDFYSSEEAEITDRLMRSLTSIGCGLGPFLAGRRGELRPSPLTPRELEVLCLAAQGNSGPEIAARLFVGRATIKTHFENIYRKLGVCDRASAVAKALRLGLMK